MDTAALKLVDFSRRTTGMGRRTAQAGLPYGLGTQGVHEVCPHTYNDMAAALGFALAAGQSAHRHGALVWISHDARLRDQGRLSPRGLQALGLSPSGLLEVRARKTKEALWAAEEAVASGAAGLVLAEVPGADFTATRRLSLACEARGTPLILLMDHAREGASAAQGRWRVAAAPSAPNRWHNRAPGATRWQVTLERSRIAPEAVSQSFLMEFEHETARLHLVSGPGARPLSPQRPQAAGPTHLLRSTG